MKVTCWSTVCTNVCPTQTSYTNVCPIISSEETFVTTNGSAWKNSRHLAMPPLFFPRNDVWETTAVIQYWWRNNHRNSIPWLMTCHYPDMGSASDWSCRVRNFLRSVISMEFRSSFIKHHFAGKIGGGGCFLRLLLCLFSSPDFPT